MLAIHDYALFVATAVLLNMTPGPDTLFVLGNSLASGRKAGIASALGISTGCLVHTVAAALGLSAMLAASATAFAAVKYAGAAYLVVIGAKMLFAKDAGAAPRAARVESHGKAFKRGVVTNVLNPKVALFFLALLPQFVDAQAAHPVPAFLALGFTFIATGTIWVVGVALLAARFGERMRRRAGATRWLTRASGGLFIGLGVKLAVSERA